MSYRSTSSFTHASSASKPSPYDPDDEWKSQIQRNIESGLAPLYAEALKLHEKELAAAPHLAEQLLEEYEAAKRNIRMMAQEQFHYEYMREQSQRRWAAGEILNPGMEEELKREQEGIYDAVRGGTRSRSGTAESRQAAQRPPEPKAAQRQPEPKRPPSPVEDEEDEEEEEGGDYDDDDDDDDDSDASDNDDLVDEPLLQPPAFSLPVPYPNPRARHSSPRSFTDPPFTNSPPRPEIWMPNITQQEDRMVSSASFIARRGSTASIRSTSSTHRVHTIPIPEVQREKAQIKEVGKWFEVERSKERKASLSESPKERKSSGNVSPIPEVERKSSVSEPRKTSVPESPTERRPTVNSASHTVPIPIPEREKVHVDQQRIEVEKGKEKKPPEFPNERRSSGSASPGPRNQREKAQIKETEWKSYVSEHARETVPAVKAPAQTMPIPIPEIERERAHIKEVDKQWLEVEKAKERKLSVSESPPIPRMATKPSYQSLKSQDAGGSFTGGLSATRPEGSPILSRQHNYPFASTSPLDLSTPIPSRSPLAVAHSPSMPTHSPSPSSSTRPIPFIRPTEFDEAWRTWHLPSPSIGSSDRSQRIPSRNFTADEADYRREHPPMVRIPSRTYTLASGTPSHRPIAHVSSRTFIPPDFDLSDDEDQPVPFLDSPSSDASLSRQLFLAERRQQLQKRRDEIEERAMRLEEEKLRFEEEEIEREEEKLRKQEEERRREEEEVKRKRLEEEARRRKEEEAVKRREEEDRHRAEQEAIRLEEERKQEEERLKSEREAEAKREEETRRKLEEEDAARKRERREEVKRKREVEREKKRKKDEEEATRLEEERRTKEENLQREKEENLQREKEENLQREKEEEAKRLVEEKRLAEEKNLEEKRAKEEQERADAELAWAEQEKYTAENRRIRDQAMRKEQKRFEEIRLAAEEKRRQRGDRFNSTDPNPNIHRSNTSSESSTSSSTSGTSKASSTGWSSSSSSASMPIPKARTPSTSASTASFSSASSHANSTSSASTATPSRSVPKHSSSYEEDWHRRQQEQAAAQAERFRLEQQHLEHLRLLKESSASSPKTKEDITRLFVQHAQMWSAALTAPSLSWDAFPWPVLKRASSPEDITTRAVMGYIQSPFYPDKDQEKDKDRTMKDRLKEHIRRWHPDRFETKLLPKVVLHDRESVQEAAGSVVRTLNELLTRSNAPGLFG